MNKKFYRVETQEVDTEIIQNSYNSRYGKSLDFRNYINFINVYLSIMKQLNISVDFLVLVNNNICSRGDEYLNEISKSIVNENFIDIGKVTEKEEHQGQKMEIKHLNTFVQYFDENRPFRLFDNGTYLWEMTLEMVRMNFFKDKPIRLDSKFFFTDIESCKYYNEKYLNNSGKIYEIEIIKQDSYFEGDMSFIDNIENEILFLDLINEYNDYWKGKLTSKPIKEVIFQGEFKYKNIT
jgi:hypothetical protein